MEIEVLKKGKNELNIQFSEIDQGVLNLIKSSLWQDNATEVASFRIDHPETGKPVFILRTKGKEAKKVWNDAIDRLGKQIDKLKSNLKSL